MGVGGGGENGKVVEIECSSHSFFFLNYCVTNVKRKHQRDGEREREPGNRKTFFLWKQSTKRQKAYIFLKKKKRNNMTHPRGDTHTVTTHLSIFFSSE